MPAFDEIGKLTLALRWRRHTAVRLDLDEKALVIDEGEWERGEDYDPIREAPGMFLEFAALHRPRLMAILGKRNQSLAEEHFPKLWWMAAYQFIWSYGLPFHNRSTEQGGKAGPIKLDLIRFCTEAALIGELIELHDAVSYAKGQQDTSRIVTWYKRRGLETSIRGREPTHRALQFLAAKAAPYFAEGVRLAPYVLPLLTPQHSTISLMLSCDSPLTLMWFQLIDAFTSGRLATRRICPECDKPFIPTRSWQKRHPKCTSRVSSRRHRESKPSQLP